MAEIDIVKLIRRKRANAIADRENPVVTLDLRQVNRLLHYIEIIDTRRQYAEATLDKQRKRGA